MDGIGSGGGHHRRHIYVVISINIIIIYIVHWSVNIVTTGEAWPLPCGLAGSLGSVRHASFSLDYLHSLYMVLPHSFYRCRL